MSGLKISLWERYRALSLYAYAATCRDIEVIFRKEVSVMLSREQGFKNGQASKLPFNQSDPAGEHRGVDGLI